MAKKQAAKKSEGAVKSAAPRKKPLADAMPADSKVAGQGGAARSPDPAPEPAAAAEAAAGKFRNRNLGTRKVRAGELLPNPKNWRKHPVSQAGAMQGILEEVGFVGTLIGRDTPEGVQLIDGHLRAETMPDDFVDVMIVDLSDREVDLILATHDPVGDIADVDVQAFDDLIRDLDFGDGALSEMLSNMADDMDAPTRERTGRQTAAAGEQPEYPIAPVFNERYEYAVIFCRNETDWGALQTILDMAREKSYKTTGVATGRVISFEKFFALWTEWTAKYGTEDSLPES